MLPLLAARVGLGALDQQHLLNPVHDREDDAAALAGPLVGVDRLVLTSLRRPSDNARSVNWGLVWRTDTETEIRALADLVRDLGPLALT